MKIKYVLVITLIIVFVSMGIGIYCKSFYMDFNKEKHALDNFAVALISDNFFESQLQHMEENLDASNIILAVQCEDTFHYRYSCVTQKVKIVSVFKGENLKEGDVFEVARAATLLSLNEDALFNKMPLINMGYINEMIPGKTYLIFLDRKLETYSERDIIYTQSDSFILAPIFCYENITNIPQNPEDEFSTYINYKKVKNNEFFIMSEESNEKVALMKDKLFSKYKLN
ncbi:MAG: hypothetical protein HFH65_05045 [Lachnospiraceae bacterium]|jgi:hypothetical protein|nr:hypothetical protein [Lachnospiraceae bacterium]